MDGDSGWLKDLIRDVPDFPVPGVSFKDITPLLADAACFGRCIELLAEAFSGERVDKVVGIEARGFIVAAPVAMRLGAGFVPVRKAGKLPWQVRRQPYTLEYASGEMEAHVDAFSPGERALIVDDVLATGGTASATRSLVDALGAETVGFGCVVELGFLSGRQRLGSLPVVSLISYE